ncbi:15761_t:CDS:2, partial [Racocetra persica]
IAIDPNYKNLEFESAMLNCQDCLRLEYDQITIAQQNITNKNKVDQYLMIKSIEPLDNSL